MKRFLCSIIAVMLLSFLPGVARANTVTVTLSGIPTAVVGGYLWTYDVTLTNGTVTTGLDHMFSIWDFDGLVGSPVFVPVAVGANYTMTALSNTDPEEFGPLFSAVNGDDDPGVVNIRGDYSGVTITESSNSPILLGKVLVVSSYNTFTFDRYISIDKGLGGGVGAFTTQVQVPLAGGGPFTPLPSTAGLGLVLLGGLGFGRVRRLSLA